mgnify:CR=1 FL=1
MTTGWPLTVGTRETLKKSSVRREAVLLAILLPFGIVFMPGAAYVVGAMVFGDYSGDGFAGFFSTIGAKLLAGQGVAWLLVASPYLIVQCLRLTLYGWRFVRRSSHST